MSPDIERELLAYLAEGKTEKVSIKDHLAKNTGAMQRIFHQLELHEAKDDARHLEVKQALAGVHARVDRLERDADDTGRHNIEDLKQQLKERQASSRTWATTWVQVVAAVAVAVASGALGVLITVLTRK